LGGWTLAPRRKLKKKKDCKCEWSGNDQVWRLRGTSEFPPKTANGRPASFFQLELQLEGRLGGNFFPFGKVGQSGKSVAKKFPSSPFPFFSFPFLSFPFFSFSSFFFFFFFFFFFGAQFSFSLFFSCFFARNVLSSSLWSSLYFLCLCLSFSCHSSFSFSQRRQILATPHFFSFSFSSFAASRRS